MRYYDSFFCWFSVRSACLLKAETKAAEKQK